VSCRGSQFLLVVQVRHSVTASNKAFSSTQLVYVKRNMTTGAKTIHDEYREAYSWLRANTPEDAKVLSWWDYGYQITTFANRTVLVDNNTWNNTHIATVGRVLTSSEEDAFPILQSLDVDYVLVLFGGKIGMGGDDLDKLSWIIRITEGVFPDTVLESEYQKKGRYVFSENATLAMSESVAYKLCYHEFNHVEDEGKSNASNKTLVGLDVSRKSRISSRDIVLRHFEPAYTTESWMLRIYRVKKD
jgi:dolichyl-diphosphooligosaccharide--protein glycosyltransferase